MSLGKIQRELNQYALEIGLNSHDQQLSGIGITRSLKRVQTTKDALTKIKTSRFSQ